MFHGARIMKKSAFGLYFKPEESSFFSKFGN